ncbi:hypothetical protein BA895_16790 [Humibacillus sp. DSM 29435]|nr:hypothetical protein BA895_16790 [Humibacillus sp. DSM 29435]
MLSAEHAHGPPSDPRRRPARVELRAQLANAWRKEAKLVQALEQSGSRVEPSNGHPGKRLAS